MQKILRELDFADASKLKKQSEIEFYSEIIPENEKLLEGMKFHRRYKDFSFMFLVGTYVLNIIDANVGAHLLQFNVSEDLSFEPYIENDYFDFSQSAGIKFKINLD